MDLREENKQLKQKLEHAQKWMQKEVSQTHQPFDSNIIEEKIYSFFPAEVLSHFPENGIKNICSSEMIFHHILSWEELDGMWVMIWYQKLVDEMIELYITKWFRKYAKKTYQISPPKNVALEKSLHLVISKGHIISLWRIYNLLKDIQKNKELHYYSSMFLEYIKSRRFLYKALLESQFLLQLETLIHLQVITEKRHSWSLSKNDTITARNVIIGNFIDKDCLLYILGNSQSVDI